MGQEHTTQPPHTWGRQPQKASARWVPGICTPPLTADAPRASCEDLRLGLPTEDWPFSPSDLTSVLVVGLLLFVSFLNHSYLLCAEGLPVSAEGSAGSAWGRAGLYFADRVPWGSWPSCRWRQGQGGSPGIPLCPDPTRRAPVPRPHPQ